MEETTIVFYAQYQTPLRALEHAVLPIPGALASSVQ